MTEQTTPKRRKKASPDIEQAVAPATEPVITPEPVAATPEKAKRAPRKKAPIDAPVEVPAPAPAPPAPVESSAASQPWKFPVSSEIILPAKQDLDAFASAEDRAIMTAYAAKATVGPMAAHAVAMSPKTTDECEACPSPCPSCDPIAKPATLWQKFKAALGL